MFDIGALVDRLFADGEVDNIRLNRTTQFGTPTRAYLGATLLPEREVDANEYTEDEIRFRTIIAVDGDRYSPAQIRDGGSIVRSMKVSLGNSDIARHLTARDYEALMKLLGRQADVEAMARVIRWADITLNLPLVELNEVQRWQCIINAQVVRRGDNNFQETVYYPNPPGSRVNVAGTWSDPTYDPWPDITGQAQKMQEAGFIVNRIITSRKVISILAANPLVAQRAGAQPLVINDAGAVVRLPVQLVSRDMLNNLASRDGLPGFETYDLSYNTQVGTARFMPDTVMVMVCTTGREEEIATEREILLVPETLGYTAIGLAVGQPDAGRVVHMEAYTNKPPRIEGEAWQTSLPVLQDPEALAVLKNIA